MTTATKTTESRFSTSDYTFAHGSAPRGYGTWIFARTVINEATSQLALQRSTTTGTLTEAKAVARQTSAPEGFVPLGQGWTVCS